MDTNLLIVPSSRCQRPGPGLVPALYRYDGPLYRVLRAARRDGYWPAGLRVLVLSPRYGLIDCLYPVADERTCHHDQRMTVTRAAALLPAVGERLACELRSAPVSIFVNLGPACRQAIPISIDYDAFAAGIDLQFARGGSDRRLVQTYAWLASLRGPRRPAALACPAWPFTGVWARWSAIRHTCPAAGAGSPFAVAR